MKKITLVLVLLVTFGLIAATAQEATVTGSATMTLGFDIADGTFGIVNSSSATIDLALVPKTSAETDAADGWYGWAKLADFSILIDETAGLTVTAPAVTARIINGPMYIQIWALDGFATGKAAAVENDADGNYTVEDDEASLGTNLIDGSGGLTFNYATDAFGVSVFFATETGYSGTDKLDNAHFLIGADATVAAGPADISLELVRGIGVAEDLGVGIGVALGMDPVDITLGVDISLPSVGDFAWEVGATVDGVFGPATAALDLIYGETSKFDVELDVDLDFAPLALGIFVGAYDDVADYRLYVDGSYAVNDQVTVSFGGGYDSLTQIPVMVSAALALIPNTTITVKYDTADVSTDTGALTVATKVSF